MRAILCAGAVSSDEHRLSPGENARSQPGTRLAYDEHHGVLDGANL
jgi:hypothetical protein